jgi:hypothetical protein
MQDQEHGQGMTEPIVEMALVAIIDVIGSVRPKIRSARLDLQGDQLAGQFAILDHLGLRIDAEVADRLLAEGPVEIVEKGGLDGIDAAPVDQRGQVCGRSWGYGTPLIENSRRSDESG